ncbi:unnamed protein product [Closterium sp. Yama58-4]|nr:unnamed protein product [Closterium sp. Yama58-4]
MAEDQVWRGVGWGMEGVRHRENQQRHAGGRVDEEIESAASALPMQRHHARAAENPAAVHAEELEDGEWVAVETELAGLENAGPQVFEETERGFEEAGDRIAAGGRVRTTAELMRRLTLVARSVARTSSEQRVRFSDCMAEIREFGLQMQGWDMRHMQDYDDLTHEYHELKAEVVRKRNELNQLRSDVSTSVAEARAAAADAGRAAAAAAVGALQEKVEDRPGTVSSGRVTENQPAGTAAEARMVEREKEDKRRREEQKREEARKAEREKEEKRQKEEEERKREEAKEVERKKEEKRQEEDEERRREEARKAEREREQKRQDEEEERKREEARKAEREKEEKRQKEEEERKREEARKAEREKEEKRQKEEEERKREEARKAEREKEEKRQKEEEERKREEARKAEREKEEKRQKEEEERKREEARKAEREKEEKRQKEEERKREEARKAEREKEEKRQGEEEERKREEARKAEREKEEKRQKEEARAMERRRAQREAELEAKRQQIAKIAETKRLEAAKRKRDLEIERRKAMEEIERIARLEEAAKEEEERQQKELEAETEKMENERRRIAVVDLVEERQGSVQLAGHGVLETQPPSKRSRIDQAGTNFDADEGSLGTAASDECVGENVSGNQNVQPTLGKATGEVAPRRTDALPDELGKRWGETRHFRSSGLTTREKKNKKGEVVSVRFNSEQTVGGVKRNMGSYKERKLRDFAVAVCWMTYFPDTDMPHYGLDPAELGLWAVHLDFARNLPTGAWSVMNELNLDKFENFENVMNKTNARVKDGAHFQVAVCTGIGQALVHGGSGLVSPPANVTPAVYAAGVAATLYTLWCASIGIPHQDWAEGADEAARGTLNEASLASRATSTARLGVWTLKAVKNLTHEKPEWEVVLTKAILGLVDPEPGEAEAIEMAKVVSRVLVYWCECCHANQNLYAYQGGMLHFPQPTKGGRRKGNAGGNE